MNNTKQTNGVAGLTHRLDKMTNLSGYQYALLLKIMKAGAMTEEEAATYNQITFGSFITRGYLEWNNRDQVIIPTVKAHDALHRFQRAEILRRIESTTLHVRFYEQTGRTPLGKQPASYKGSGKGKQVITMKPASRETGNRHKTRSMAG